MLVFDVTFTVPESEYQGTFEMIKQQFENDLRGLLYKGGAGTNVPFAIAGDFTVLSGPHISEAIETVERDGMVVDGDYDDSVPDESQVVLDRGDDDA